MVKRKNAGASQKKTKKTRSKNKARKIIAIDRILVPIDFSEHSKKALQYAIPFAEQFGASIDLLYVVEPAIYPADFSFGQLGVPNIEDELRKRGQNELESLQKEQIAKRVPSRTNIRVGKPFYEINQYAQEEDVDLIIIATHGHTGMEYVLFGSTAEKVVRRAPCPVLVVRNVGKELIGG